MAFDSWPRRPKGHVRPLDMHAAHRLSRLPSAASSAAATPTIRTPRSMTPAPPMSSSMTSLNVKRVTLTSKKNWWMGAPLAFLFTVLLSEGSCA